MTYGSAVLHYRDSERIGSVEKFPSADQFFVNNCSPNRLVYMVTSHHHFHIIGRFHDHYTASPWPWKCDVTDTCARLALQKFGRDVTLGACAKLKIFAIGDPAKICTRENFPLYIRYLGLKHYHLSDCQRARKKPCMNQQHAPVNQLAIPACILVFQWFSHAHYFCVQRAYAKF